MPYRAVFDGIVNVDGEIKRVKLQHNAPTSPHAVHCCLLDLLDQCNAAGRGPGFPKLMASGTLTLTSEREPSPQYSDARERLKLRQEELARKEGIVEIAPEGG